jgi:hypothetical protein
MADNVFYISAGLIPGDNTPGAVANTFHISAGLVPNDTAGGGGVLSYPFGDDASAGLSDAILGMKSYQVSIGDNLET